MDDTAPMTPGEREHARQAARAAVLHAWGRVADLRDGEMRVVQKVDGPQTEADVLANETILADLRALFPGGDHAFLSEETADDAARLASRRVWIIDPIDGTADFIAGREDFALQVALAEAGEGGARLVAAAVYAPITGRLYTAALGGGATVEVEMRGEGDPRWWEGVPLERRTPDVAGFGPPQSLRTGSAAALMECVAVVSRSHMTRRLRAALEALPLRRAYQRGSLGIKLCEIAEGRADLYLNCERGRGHQWDLAAPELILTEAGGRVTDLDGRDVAYNVRETALPGGIVASNGACHAAVLEALAGVPSLRRDHRWPS